MERCDVLIVGGGPAGSTCAAALVRAGLDVVVADKAAFPRDKVCAGWITPAVVEELALDLADYARGRTLDPILGFRVGRMGDRMHEHRYARPMSYGIRRCEFDHYLLERSGARLAPGRRVSAFERRGARWIVNDEFDAAVLVGAGGHFCPVARALAGGDDTTVVAAEEAEFELDDEDLGGCSVEAGLPELYFTSDLAGYGWAFRKQNFLNIGLGVRAGAHGGAGNRNGARLSRRIEEFVSFLVGEGRIVRRPKARMAGHAYALRPDSRRSVAGDGFVLVGDAAGLAYDRSGEGIRPAVESGMMAARVIRDALASGSSGTPGLAAYAEALERRFGQARRGGFDAGAILPQPLLRLLATRLMGSAWFSRHVVLERWFLHAHEHALAAA